MSLPNVIRRATGPQLIDLMLEGLYLRRIRSQLLEFTAGYMATSFAQTFFAVLIIHTSRPYHVSPTSCAQSWPRP